MQVFDKKPFAINIFLDIEILYKWKKKKKFE